MLTIFQQVLILFIFIAVGYILCKLKVVKYEHSQILSALAVYIFFPSKVFKTFAMDMNLEYIKAKYPPVSHFSGGDSGIHHPQPLRGETAE